MLGPFLHDQKKGAKNWASAGQIGRVRLRSVAETASSTKGESRQSVEDVDTRGAHMATTPHVRPTEQKAGPLVGNRDAQKIPRKEE